MFTGRCALVPAQFFEPGSARAMLVEVSEVDDAETVSSVAIPYYDAVLVYAHQEGETALPELYHLLKASEVYPTTTGYWLPTMKEGFIS